MPKLTDCIPQQIDIPWIMHIDCGHDGISAHRRRGVGAFFQNVSGSDHHPIDTIQGVRREQAQGVCDHLPLVSDQIWSPAAISVINSAPSTQVLVMGCDVSLSHHGTDKPQVRELRRRLHAQVVEDDLGPGQRRHNGLAAGPLAAAR